MIDHYKRLKAKDVSIMDYLGRKGVKHSHSSGNNSFWFSPFRAEKDASFCVNTVKNRWTDWGATKDYKGDVIDLVQRLEGLDRYTDAIEFLLTGTIKRGNYQSAPREQRNNVIIRDKLEIKSETLINYLRNKRGIDIDLARKYCVELHVVFPHKHPTRQHKVIGFKNKKGGYDFRNEYMKLGNSPKYYSLIKGGNKTILFEGFIDFLTALMYYRVDRFKSDVIVLNSVNMVAYAEPLLRESKQIYTFVDNDRAGNDLVRHVKDLNNNTTDMRSVYYTYKDFNFYWMSVRKELEFMESVGLV